MKKDEQISVHMPGERKLQLKRLAEAEGLTASEFVNSLIDERLSLELSRYRLLHEVFIGERTMGFGENSEVQ